MPINARLIIKSTRSFVNNEVKPMIGNKNKLINSILRRPINSEANAHGSSMIARVSVPAASNQLICVADTAKSFANTGNIG